jgi:hypothetical protein
MVDDSTKWDFLAIDKKYQKDTLDCGYSNQAPSKVHI